MGVRKANARILKQLGITTSAMAGLSIVNLFNSGFSIGWVEPFRSIVAQYLVITNTVKHAVEPYVIPAFDMFAKLFSLNIYFGSNWPDIFLLMVIYLGSRVKSYISNGKYFRAAIMLLLSFAICIASSFFASSVNLITSTDVFIATAIPMLGFLVYDLFYGFVGASLDRGGKPWLNEFGRHLAFSMPLLLLTIFLNLILSIILIEQFGANTYQAFVIVFSFDYLVIAAYWALQSLHHAENRENCNLGESVSQRFWRSSATNVALNVGIVLFSAIFFMLGNAGLQSAGYNASLLLSNAI